MNSILEVLLDFRFGPIWDGNLPSKSDRDWLVDYGYLERGSGFQWLTQKGIQILYELQYLNQDTWRKR